MRPPAADPALHPALDRAFDLLRDTFRAGGKMLLCGNGGSAADCDHWSAELMKAFRRPRPFSLEESHQLGAYVDVLQGGLPAIPLPNLTALNTAWINDCEPQYVFAQGVWALGKPGDVLVGISTSGRSNNVFHALKVAKLKGLRTLVLTGATPSPLESLADVLIAIPSTVTESIQEMHLKIYHQLSAQLEQEFFGQ